MKILVATGIYPPEIGGPATYAALIEKELPKEGICVQVLPFSLVRRYPKVVRHVLYFFIVLRLAKKVDIVYALDPVSVGLPAAIAAKFLKKKFIIRLGGDYAWEQYLLKYSRDITLEKFWDKNIRLPLFVRLLRLVQSYVTRSAVAVISPSNYLKTVITKWGVEPHKIRVIHSVIDSVTVDKEREEIRTEKNFAYPTLCTAGRLVPWKGFGGVIQIVARLKKKYPNIQLIIAGDGEKKEALEAAIAELDIKLSVQLVGRLSSRELAEVIKGSDLFVLNTAYEGLSHQLVEVMAQGVPIITTRVGGNPELITDGKNGVLVTHNSIEELELAVIKVLEDNEKTVSMVANAKETVNLFSKEAMISSLVSVLKKYE